MSKYPVEQTDDDGQIDAINYLLSGPAGLGQNFSGFSSNDGVVLTGNPRPPFAYSDTAPVIYPLYVAPISLSTSEMLDGRTYKFTFSSTQPAAPFNLGCPIVVSGVTDATYNQTFTPIGVVECTDTYVIARAETSITVVASSTGGTVGFNVTTIVGDPVSWISTDCQATVTVTGASDRVFICAQTAQSGYYECTVSDLIVTRIAVNRYKVINVGSSSVPIYQYVFDKTIISDDNSESVTTATLDVLPIFNFIIASFIDQPVIGTYLYILQTSYSSSGDAKIVQIFEGLRTLTAQVVKE